MLQTLEKEIDDVDAKIGDRWRLLDRFFLYFEIMVNCFYFLYAIYKICEYGIF